jgi:hypothetical protein
VSHPGKPRYPQPPPAVSSENSTVGRRSGRSPEGLRSFREGLRPEQGAGSREQGAGNGYPQPSVAPTPRYD